MILVVGAGITGAVIARELADKGYSVFVIDKRGHLAGNCFDFVDANGFRVHKYGPHLFHTSNEKVFQWLSRFTEWIPYKHKVKALYRDEYLTLPVNRETLSRVGGRERAIDVFFRPYTRKMWGMTLEEMDPSILKRVPIREDDNEFYFPDDVYQALPAAGYTELVCQILSHSNISVSLNTSFSKELEQGFDFIFNCMPIDEYFKYSLGRLPYRSIKFRTTVIDIPRVLPVATVNFTHDGPCTRITEWKILPNSPKGKNPNLSVLTSEEPCDYLDNHEERFYPVKDPLRKNQDLYQRYSKMVPNNMKFVGRCGLYRYIDMDDSVELALNEVERF